MVTTIQLRETVKNELDRLKTNNKTYEDVILDLMKISEQYKRRQKALLVEGCKEMAGESLKITKEWGIAGSELDWEW
ncbi:hypothetical protein HZA33_04885 [Candidatus Pacearchaeota archaeon]|nr:hypothetical protein [Candidatus Pacearchaeota archaeon]